MAKARKIKSEDAPEYKKASAKPGALPANVQAAVDVIRTYLEQNTPTPGEAMGGSQDAVHYLIASGISLEKSEVFGVMYMDTRHRLISFEKMFRGSVDRAHVYPREILRRALELNAAALILTHNHPSGIPEPSTADIELTGRLVGLCKELEIRVLDHIIVAGATSVSMAERNLM